MTNEKDTVFSGSIPDVYDKFLVPLIFEPYAVDLSRGLLHSIRSMYWKRRRAPAC